MLMVAMLPYYILQTTSKQAKVVALHATGTVRLHLQCSGCWLLAMTRRHLTRELLQSIAIAMIYGPPLWAIAQESTDQGRTEAASHFQSPMTSSTMTAWTFALLTPWHRGWLVVAATAWLAGQPTLAATTIHSHESIITVKSWNLRQVRQVQVALTVIFITVLLNRSAAMVLCKLLHHHPREARSQVLPQAMRAFRTKIRARRITRIAVKVWQEQGTLHQLAQIEGLDPTMLKQWYESKQAETPPKKANRSASVGRG